MRSALTVIFILSALVIVWADVYNECDYGRLNSTKGVYLGAVPGYNTASSFFDNDGKSHDLNGTSTFFQFPIRAGFAFNEYWTAYFLLPLGQLTLSDGSSSSSDFGLSNPWLVAKWVRPTGSGFSLGPRLGIRFPFASSTPDNPDSSGFAMGDKSFGIDLAAVGRSQSENHRFRLDTSAGIRYYGEASYNGGAKAQPGMFYYITADPGFAWGRSKSLATYAILRYEGAGDSKANGDTVSNSSFYTFTLGLKQDWMVDANNCLELRGGYPIMGNNSLRYLQIALGYNGIIPTR